MRGDSMAADESRAVVERWIHTWNTHDAEAREAAVRFEGQEMYRVRDGKIAEQFVLLGSLGLMQQLGVVPTPS
jgi:hypothetical protein